jgi:glycosyltransferase involved in cell wall biosynthesis
MEQSTLLFLRELQAMGHETELISLNPVGELGPKLAEHGIPVSSSGYEGKWGWKSYLPLRRMLRDKHPDAFVMVGHNLMASLAIGNLCAGRRIMDIRFHHQGVLPNWAWRLIYRVANPRFKFITFPSRFIMNEAMAICSFLKEAPEGKCHKMPFPVVLEEITTPEQKRQARVALGLPEGIKLVGNAGWLVDRKRMDVFLSVAQLVLKQVPAARFVIAGDGPLKDDLHRHAEALGIADKVLWLGWQQDLERFYLSLDLLLFNSDWDSMGRTPLEAMSHGVPVVASVVHGGLKEVISREEYGIVLDTHDIPALSANVFKILKDDALASRMSQAGHSRIAEVGSPRKYAEAMLSLLNA